MLIDEGSGMDNNSYLQYKDFQCKEKEGAFFLTINRPPLNILTISSLQELSTILDALKMRNDILTIVLSGTGDKAFSAGLEIQEYTPEKIGELILSYHSIYHKLVALPQITIAVVKGYCLGAGCELVSFCDMAIAEEGSLFGQPEINVGCLPSIGTAIFPLILGFKSAAELVLTGRHIHAEKAKKIGLINKVVPNNLLEKTVTNQVQEMTQKSWTVLKLAKKALRINLDERLLKNIKQVEQIYLQELTHTEDCKEGIMAFLEKRPPRWSEHKETATETSI